MTPPPTNAPEAGSNGERDELIQTLHAAAHTVTADRQSLILKPEYAAQLIQSAGFTRAHHDGERVARSYAEHHAPTLAERLALAERLYLFLDTEPGHSIYAGAPAETRAKWLNAADGVIGGGWGRERYATDIATLTRERDEARAAFDSSHTRHAECAGELYAAEVERDALRAERDALAAKLAEAETALEHDRATMLSTREAERARTASAEAKLAQAEERHKADVHAAVQRARREWFSCGTSDLARMLTAAESRAAALAEALRKISAYDWSGAWRDIKSMNDVVDEMVAAARAALAGNGNGTGEGDGWIACSEQMPEDGVLVLLLHQCASWGPEPWKHTIGQVVDDGETWAWADENDTVQDWELVTHWMPLPAAPPSAGEKQA